LYLFAAHSKQSKEKLFYVEEMKRANKNAITHFKFVAGKQNLGDYNPSAAGMLFCPVNELL
jgi:hypothetical protein